jgi:hypothetical protein
MKKYPFAGVMVLVANEAQAATLNFVGHPLLERSGTNILGRVYDLEVLYGGRYCRKLWIGFDQAALFRPC